MSSLSHLPQGKWDFRTNEKTQQKLGIRVYPILNCLGGDDWRNFEPISRPRTTVSFNRVNKIVMDLRRIYKENPAYFDVPAFAQKVY